MADDPRIAPDLTSLVRLKGEARGFSFLHRQPVTSLLAGKRASRIRGRGLAFEELREYRAGDDTRMIDWRASARTGRTQTRVFTEERDRPTLLLVDLGSAMFFGSRYATKCAVAAQAAALAAWRGLAAGDRLGAIVFGDDDQEVFRPHRSATGVLRILGAVARRAAALAAAPPHPAAVEGLRRALRQAEAMAGHDWLVLVIADLGAGDPDCAAAIGRLARHNDVVAIAVSDPIEAALPDAPWRAIATDGASTGVVEPGRAGLGDRVRAKHAARLDHVRRAGLHLQIPVLPLSTDQDAAVQLRRLLGAAASPLGRRR
jgi:uncharacterized protein (DUF58 family)